MIKVNINGKIVELPTLKGADGKSAYQYAVEGGFEGTEQEFINFLIRNIEGIEAHNVDPESHADIRELIENINVTATGGVELESLEAWDALDDNKLSDNIDYYAPVDGSEISIEYGNTRKRESIVYKADLNNYLDCGYYKCESDTNAASLTNCPVTESFVMDNISGNGLNLSIDVNTTGTSIVQKIMTINGVQYFREIYSDTESVIYGDWKKILDTSDIVDSLESTATDKAASANQLRIIAEAFQDGCDTIVAGCTTYGQTPASNSPDDIVDAIAAIYNSRYSAGYTSGNSDGYNKGYTAGRTGDNVAILSSFTGAYANDAGNDHTATWTNTGSARRVIVVGTNSRDGYMPTDFTLTTSGTITNKRIIVNNTQHTNMSDRVTYEKVYIGTFLLATSATITLTTKIEGSPGFGYGAIIGI